MATYVEITVDEFLEWIEDYARSTQAIHGWSKKEATKGIFLLYLSDEVAIKVSSSLGDTRSKGYAQAAIHAMLVSRITGRVLNKKAAEQSHVKRTMGWRDSLKKVCNRLIAAFQDKSKFYEVIASEGGLEGYVDYWKGVIEAVANWRTNRFLADLYSKLDQNRLLSDLQESKILETAKNPAVQPPQEIRVEEGPQNEASIDWGAYIESAPNWEKNRFLTDILSKVNQGQSLSPGQVSAVVRSVHREKWMDRMRGAYRGASPEARALLAEIGRALGRNFKVEGPSRSDQETLATEFPGVFDDLLEGPINPKIFQVSRTASAMAERITALYFASRI